MLSHTEAELELTYKFANAPIAIFPFPHFFIQDVFPKEFYDALQSSIPDPSVMIPIEEARPVRGYKERFVLEIGKQQYLDKLPEHVRGFWSEFAGWLCSGRFANFALQKFHPVIHQRFGSGPQPAFSSEAMLVEDITKYALGPHTDSTKKVVTMLFYLPKDTSQSHIGTSIYLPKDPNFRCAGGPHYGFDDFVKLHTMPFLPNSLFVFCKTDNSFHGVEPVTDPDTRRWLLLFDVYHQAMPAQTINPASAGARAMPNISFKY